MSINFIRIAVTKYNLDFSDFVTGESVYYYTMRDKNNLVLIYPTLETPTDIVTLKNYFSSASNKINVQATIGEGYYEALSGHLNLFSDYSLSQKAVSHKATFVAESVIGSKYNDTVRTGEYADGIVSGDGNDKIYAGNGDDVVCGEDGADYIDGGAGNDVLFGGDGNDTIKGGDGKDTIYGDFASYETMLALVPENYSEYMIENKDDVINAISKASGNNIINGGNGDDIIDGGERDDIIHGGKNDDSIIGGKGNDKLYGDEGTNLLFFKEGDGNDIIYMNSKGSDKLIFDEETLLSITYEKNGNDLVIKYGSENDTVTVSKYFSTKNPSVDRIYTGELDNNGNIVYDEDDYLSLKNDIILLGEDGDIERTINDKQQTIKGKRYVGNEYNNNIVVSSTKYDLIQTYDDQNEYNEESNDYIYMQSKWGYADGGYGDDIYVVKSLANETVINDVDGNDTLKISDSKKNINVLFDVDSDGKIIDDTICFMNKSAMNKLLSKGIKPNSGIHINGNNQDSGIIERIETSDGYYISDTTINTIATNVASWLSSNPKGYSSSMEVLMNGDRDEIASIMQCYQTIEWCKQV